MGSLSNYSEQRVLDSILGSSHNAALFPSSVYVALYTVTPTETGGGTEVSTTSTGYARVAMTNNDTNWPAANVSSVKSNGTAITFPTAVNSWGTVVAFGILDAASGGNLIVYGAVSPSVSIGAGTTPFFSVGALTISAD